MRNEFRIVPRELALVRLVKIPKGVAVGALAIGSAGAFNASLLAAQMLANNDAESASRIDTFRRE